MNAVVPFSTALRERSSDAHSPHECDGFMTDLLTGAGTRDDYIALIAQHWFIYAALEEAAGRMRSDPVASVFLQGRHSRLPALEADLGFLIGDDWRERITPLPSTQRYMDRLRWVAATGWGGGFVAHHYTRYLGDLSGGQVIGRVLDRELGLEGRGTAFYAFPEVPKPKPYKDGYRARLDALELSPEQQARVVAEVSTAFDLNQAVFAELGALLPTFRRLPA